MLGLCFLGTQGDLLGNEFARKGCACFARKGRNLPACYFRTQGLQSTCKGTLCRQRFAGNASHACVLCNPLNSTWLPWHVCKARVVLCNSQFPSGCFLRYFRTNSLRKHVNPCLRAKEGPTLVCEKRAKAKVGFKARRAITNTGFKTNSSFIPLYC